MRTTSSVALMACLLMPISNSSVSAETRLAHIFNDHMVLQRDKPLTIWGRSDPGAAVTVTITEDRAEAIKAVGQAALNRVRRESPKAKPGKDDNAFSTPKVRLSYVHEDRPVFKTVFRQARADSEGRWSVEFAPMQASFNPKFICLSGAAKSAVLDVLVGEVWLTAGQSNMAWAGNRSAWLDNAGLLEPAVRYTSHSHSAPKPLSDFPKRSDWRICTAGDDGVLKGVSTIPYLFAKNLHRQLKVPVGVINTASGGSLGSEWTGLAELRSIDHPRVKALFSDEKKMPARNFNGRVAPIGKLSIRGAMFMQGEQQALTHCIPRYRQIFPTIIKAFRRAFGDDKLPFGIITLQLQGAPEAEDAMANGYAIVSDIHYQTHLKTPGTGFITGHDVTGGLHPMWKRPLAERAVLWAMTDVYGAPGAGQRDRGGQQKYKMTVTFDRGAARVYLMQPRRVRGKDGSAIRDVPVNMYYPRTYDCLPYSGFAVADEDGRWYPGRVRRAVDESYLTEQQKRRKKIFYNCLQVRHPLVSRPVALRYGFGDGSAHLGGYYTPIPPYRTESWTTWRMEEGVKNRPIMHTMQAVAERDRWDRKGRETVYDAHEADLNLHATPKEMLRTLADRISIGLELIVPGKEFRRRAAALSKASLDKVSQQYRRPDNLWGKKAMWWVRAHRLRTLPQEMDKALKDPKVAAAYKQLHESLKSFRAAVDELPPTAPLPKDIRPAPLPELNSRYSTQVRKAWVKQAAESSR